jgi:hypothetical protein
VGVGNDDKLISNHGAKGGRCRTLRQPTTEPSPRSADG